MTFSAATSARTSPVAPWNAGPSSAVRNATSRCCSSTWWARRSWPPPGRRPRSSDLLNEFFRVVVDTVNRHGGFVNKFQGDAALAIFGAPIEHPDASGAALAASRELHDELLNVLGSDMEFGIGVSAGRAIAGHIGAQARFEYTVIGDPVNEAARLTELAKLEDGHVLASAIAVSGALDAEALCWDVGEIVELRGRSAPTQLARPLNLVEATRRRPARFRARCPDSVQPV